MATKPMRLPRVVSLLPSATELVAAAGGLHMLVGRSHECDYPPSVRELPILTSANNAFESSAQMDAAVVNALNRGNGLYAVDEKLLIQLNPTHIVTQDLCHVCAVDLKLVERVVDALEEPPQLVCLNPHTLEDMLLDLAKVGHAVGHAEQADAAVEALRERIRRASRIAAASLADNDRPPLKVAYLEWVDPLFPGGHWTPQLLRLAGADHPINPVRGEGAAPPSFAMAPEPLIAADCDWIIVGPCGLNLQTSKKELPVLLRQDWWKELRAVKEGRVVVVDGDQMFNRPSPRLVDALEWLVGLLHNRPDVIPPTFPWAWMHDLLKDTAYEVAAPVFDGGSGGPPLPEQAMSKSGAATPQPAPATQVETGSPQGLRSDGSLAKSGPAGAGGEAARSEALDAVACSGSAEGQLSPALPGEARGGEACNGGSDGNTGEGGGELEEEEYPSEVCLAPEIEEAHAGAETAGRTTYKDPATGYTVFTAGSSVARGSCCGNRCRHCPFGHQKVAPSFGPRLNRIKVPVLLRPGKEGVRGSATLLVWLGGLESHMTLRLLEERHRAERGLQNGPGPFQPVLVAAFDISTGRVWGRKGVLITNVMDQGLRIYAHVVAVPWMKMPDPTNPEHVEAALATARALLGSTAVDQVACPACVARPHTENDGLPPPECPLEETPEAELINLWKEDQSGGHVLLITPTGKAPTTANNGVTSTSQLCDLFKGRHPSRILYTPVAASRNEGCTTCTRT
eukprot:jgi/Botrbrau1/971/Bobra.114_1s0013.1